MENAVYKNYDYKKLETDLNFLKGKYPFTTIGSIGQSVQNRELYYVKLGTGSKKIHINATHHSLEWITTAILIHFLKKACDAIENEDFICEYSMKELFENVTLYAVPMLNPDGVELVINDFIYTNPNYNFLSQFDIDFKHTWQSNANGVDLNHNYPALFYEGKENIEIKFPGPTKYSGESPLDQPETFAMYNHIKSIDFDMVIALHSQGQEIYYNSSDIIPRRSLEIANALSEVSGYVVNFPSGSASYSGFKDWFIKEYNRPGFTIEVGNGKNPLPISDFNLIYPPVERLILKSLTII